MGYWIYIWSINATYLHHAWRTQSCHACCLHVGKKKISALGAPSQYFSICERSHLPDICNVSASCQGFSQCRYFCHFRMKLVLTTLSVVPCKSKAPKVFK